jgi:hypothetical protein
MGGKSTQELALLDQASQALAEARSLDEIKMIRDKAEAVRKYAQSASMGLDVQNRAAEVKLRAERQAGKLLAQLMLRGGDRRSKSHCDRLKLDDLGLTANQSKRWQLQAKVPEDLFREHVQHTCDEGKELTSAGLMRLAKRLKGDSDHRQRYANGNNGHIINGSVVSRNGKAPSGQFSARSDSTYGEVLSELRNHHKVLDGILSPLYGGETTVLRPAELRMLRYLMTETGKMLAQLDRLENAAIGFSCRQDRAAI